MPTWKGWDHFFTTDKMRYYADLKSGLVAAGDLDSIAVLDDYEKELRTRNVPFEPEGDSIVSQSAEPELISKAVVTRRSRIIANSPKLGGRRSRRTCAAAERPCHNQPPQWTGSAQWLPEPGSRWAPCRPMNGFTLSRRWRSPSPFQHRASRKDPRSVEMRSALGSPRERCMSHSMSASGRNPSAASTSAMPGES